MTSENISTNFLTLPRELRDKVYELCLLKQEPLEPWRDHYQRQRLTTGLLRVNKTVHREASLLLYGSNHFDFAEANSEDIASFLKTIGRNNAECIRHVRIDFPRFHYIDPGDVTLEKDSIEILTSLQKSCADLRTITTSLFSTTAMEIRLDRLEHYKLAIEALKLVDSHFKTIVSLQEIVIEVYKDSPNSYIRSKMEGHGWNVSATEYVEAWSPILTPDWLYSNSELGWDDDYDDRDFGYLYEFNDEYDIDNDSDFWRRMEDDD